MGRRAKGERATVIGKLVFDEISIAKLLLLIRKFRDAVEPAHTLLFRRELSEGDVKRKLT